MITFSISHLLQLCSPSTVVWCIVSIWIWVSVQSVLPPWAISHISDKIIKQFPTGMVGYPSSPVSGVFTVGHPITSINHSLPRVICDCRIGNRPIEPIRVNLPYTPAGFSSVSKVAAEYSNRISTRASTYPFWGRVHNRCQSTKNLSSYVNKPITHVCILQQFNELINSRGNHASV